MVLRPAPPQLWGVGLWNVLEAKLAPIVSCLIWLLEVLTFFCNLALPAALTPSFNINVPYIFNMPFRSPPLHIVWASFPLCSYTWLLAQGCVYLHTEAKSNQTKEHRRHKHRVSRVHFWAPQSRKEPGITSRRFLLASSRTALEQHTTVTFSCLRIAASAGSSSTTTLPWVGDKILSLVSPSLHVWVVLKQRREKYSSDLTPVLGGQPSHSTLFPPSDLNIKA